jgi:hypothetical protein
MDPRIQIRIHTKMSCLQCVRPVTKVVERVQRGQILSQPSACPHQVYEVRPINILTIAVLLTPDPDPNSNFHFNGDQTRIRIRGSVYRHQNDADPHTDLATSFTYVGKSKFFFSKLLVKALPVCNVFILQYSSASKISNILTDPNSKSAAVIMNYGSGRPIFSGSGSYLAIFMVNEKKYVVIK